MNTEPLKKNKRMTTSSTESKAINSEITKEEALQNWEDWPTQSLANLFYYTQGGVSQKVIQYQLNEQQFKDLMDPLDDEKSIEIRIYMAVTPNRDPSVPFYTPIIQAYNVDAIPTDVNYNSDYPSFIPGPVPNDRQSAKREVPKEEAEKMINDWYHYLRQNVPNLFESAGKRLAWTTFDKCDSDRIRGVFKNHPSGSVILNLYLGYSVTTEPQRPYGFRTILEVNANNGEDQLFFEFSNPCPPLCGGNYPCQGTN